MSRMPIEKSVKMKEPEDEEKVLVTDGKWDALESCAAIGRKCFNVLIIYG